MKSWTNVKGVIVGGLLTAGIFLLAGAARDVSLRAVGRFQLATTNTEGYLVDTVTGQVWHSSNADFRQPKLPVEPTPARSSAVRTPATRTRPTRTPAAGTPATFIGRWTLTHPTEGRMGIEIEPDGKAVLREDDKSWVGQWHAEGNQITITTEDDTLRAELDPQGRLLVKEGGGEAIPFERAQ